MLYIVSYDLRTPGQDYPKLITTLKALGGVKVLLSAWLLPNDAGALDVLKHVKANGGLDPNDRILVMEVTTKSAWSNLLADDDTIQKLFRHARA